MAGYFEISPVEAKATAREVGKTVSRWRTVAKEAGVAGHEIERMASAFEHRDLAKAVGS